MKTYVVKVGKKYYDGQSFGPLSNALLFKTKKAANEEMDLYNEMADLFLNNQVEYEIIPAIISITEE